MTPARTYRSHRRAALILPTLPLALAIAAIQVFPVASVALATLGFAGIAASITRRRHSVTVPGSDIGTELSAHDRLTLWLIRLLPVTVATAVQSRVVSWAGLATIAFAALLSSTFVPPHPGGRSLIRWDFVALLATAELSWLVNPHTRHITIVLIAFGAVIASLSRLSASSKLLVGPAIMDGIGIFLVASVLLYYVVGMHSGADANRIHQVLSAAHLFGTRVTFPLSSGITTPPAMAAAFLVGLAASPSELRGQRRVLLLFAAFAAIIALLASNGRTAMVVALCLSAAAVWAPRALLRSAPLIAVAALCLPLLAQSINSSLVPILSVVPYFDRGVVGSEPASFGGRTPIWKAAIRTYREEPATRQLFGYGAQGHIASGAAKAYARYLRGFLRHPNEGHPHNTALQTLFDSGLVGLGTLLLVVARTLRSLGYSKPPVGVLSSGSRARASGAAMLLALTCTGSTDPLLSPGAALETFWVFLLICISVSLLRCQDSGGIAESENEASIAA